MRAPIFKVFANLGKNFTLREAIFLTSYRWLHKAQKTY